MATITGFLRASMNIEYWRSAARLDQTVTNARQKLFSHDDDDDDYDDYDDYYDHDDYDDYDDGDDDLSVQFFPN